MAFLVGGLSHGNHPANFIARLNCQWRAIIKECCLFPARHLNIRTGAKDDWPRVVACVKADFEPEKQRVNNAVTLAR